MNVKDRLNICALVALLGSAGQHAAAQETSQADAPFGCKVVMCLAAQDWRSISYCVPVIQKLHADMRKRKPPPFPTCPNVSDGGRMRWAKLDHTQCPKDQAPIENLGMTGPAIRDFVFNPLAGGPPPAPQASSKFCLGKKVGTGRQRYTQAEPSRTETAATYREIESFVNMYEITELFLIPPNESHAAVITFETTPGKSQTHALFPFTQAPLQRSLVTSIERLRSLYRPAPGTYNYITNADPNPPRVERDTF